MIAILRSQWTSQRRRDKQIRAAQMQLNEKVLHHFVFLLFLLYCYWFLVVFGEKYGEKRFV